MARFDGFVGPSYTLPSIQADCQRSQNLFAEALHPQSKSVSALIGKPGIKRFALLPTSPVRGLWAGDNRLFAAAGSKLYEVVKGVVNTNGTAVARTSGTEFGSWMAGLQIVINRVAYTISGAPADGSNLTLTGSAGVQSGVEYTCAYERGEIGDDTNHTLVMMWANTEGTQLGLVSAGKVYVDTGTEIKQPTYTASGDPVLADMGCFIDGYLIVMIPNTNYFQLSKPGEFLEWDETDKASKTGAPDRLRAIHASHQELWLVGSETSEVWRDTGNGLGGFAFERAMEATIQQGIAAPWCMAQLTDGPVWIGADVRGQGVAYKGQGYQPVPISTPAVESAWEKYSMIQDAESYVYVENKHQFWVINFPSGNATWVYDDATGLWHERSYGTSGRQKQRCHAFAFQKHLCGDYSSGDIWEQSLEFFDDNGNAITYLRTCPHISNEGLRVFHSRLRLEFERGQGATYSMRYSDDGGHTYSAAETKFGGASGSYKADVMWQRLGSTADRVYEVSSTSAVRQVWTGAFLDVAPGNS